jgi:hypothetical protein
MLKRTERKLKSQGWRKISDEEAVVSKVLNRKLYSIVYKNGYNSIYGVDSFIDVEYDETSDIRKIEFDLKHAEEIRSIMEYFGLDKKYNHPGQFLADINLAIKSQEADKARKRLDDARCPDGVDQNTEGPVE